MFSTLSVAQNHSPDTSQILDLLRDLLGGQGEEALQYLQTTQQLDSFDLRALAPNHTFVEILGNLQQVSLPNMMPIRSATTINLDQYYLQYDTLFSGEPNQWFTNLGISQQLSLIGLPFSIKGTGILKDGQLDTKLSGISLSFDHRTLIRQYEQAYIKQLQIPKLWSKSANLLDLSEEGQAYFINEIRFQLYQYIITSNPFNQIKTVLQNKLDSIQNSQDTTLPATLQKTQQQIEKIEQLYRQSWRNKSLHKQQAINELDRKSKSFLAQLNAYKDPERLKNSLLKRKDLSIKEKLFLLTKHFDLGRFNLVGEGIAIRHLVLNGIHYQIDHKRWFAEVAWGRQSFNANFFPTFNRSFFDRFSSNQIVYTKAGIGNEQENNFQINILHIKEGGERNDSILLYPKQNLVVSLSGQKKVGTSWNITSELAFSDHDLKGTNQEGPDGGNDPKRVAGEMSLDYRPGDGRYLLGAGVFYTGSRFISLGNPFLLTNRQGLLVKLGTKVSKKLSLDLQAKYGHSIGQDDLFEGELSDLQLVGGLQWIIGEAGNISLKMAPNTFKQSGSGNFNVSNNNSLYHLQGQFQSKLGPKNLSSLIGYTNYRSNFTYYDTSSLDQFNYLFVQESLSLTDHHSLNATLTVGGSNPLSGHIEETFIQLSYRFQEKKIQCSLGSQLFQDRFDTSWRYGISADLRFPLSPHLTVGLDMMYQSPLNAKQGDRIIGHTSLSMTF